MHVLKVNIHCDGCKHKVKKILHRIEGVYEVDIDKEEQKVTITGPVDIHTLIKKLIKSGKKAEIWPVNNGQNQSHDNCVDRLERPENISMMDPKLDLEQETQSNSEFKIYNFMYQSSIGGNGHAHNGDSDILSCMMPVMSTENRRQGNVGFDELSFNYPSSMMTMNNTQRQRHNQSLPVMLMNLNMNNQVMPQYMHEKSNMKRQIIYPSIQEIRNMSTNVIPRDMQESQYQSINYASPFLPDYNTLPYPYQKSK